MHINGKIACLGFFAASLVQVVLDRLFLTDPSLEPVSTLVRLSVNTAVTFPSCYFFAWRLCPVPSLPFIWRSQLLGTLFACGCLIIFHRVGSFTSFGWYMCIMTFFHFSEFFVTSVIRPQNLSTDSFLLNHSKAYGIAASVSWFEYLLELWLFPSIKGMNWLCIIGILICVVGEVIRKSAMLTAGSNFDHLIRITREDEHQLVTSGIYSLCRHPSYVGWFYWSVGTQLVLCNPFCCVAYALVSWRFFYERVFEEEMTLLHFFGDDYEVYQNSVPTGLPFIRGYVEY